MSKGRFGLSTEISARQKQSRRVVPAAAFIARIKLFSIVDAQRPVEEFTVPSVKRLSQIYDRCET
jgi:hypothetical protein